MKRSIAIVIWRVQKGVEYFPEPPYADVPIPATIR